MTEIQQEKFLEAEPQLQLQPSPQAMEAADLLVAYLEQIGIEFVFGVPGGAIEPLYNALSRSARRGGPRPVVARHGFLLSSFSFPGQWISLEPSIVANCD